MESESRKKIKTSLVMDPELWAEFKVHCSRKRVDPSTEMARLLEKELRGARIPTGEELHELLDELLAQGAGQHIETISELLELLAFSLRVGGRYTPEEMRALRQHLSKLPPDIQAD
jgi:hypothetical protein